MQFQVARQHGLLPVEWMEEKPLTRQSGKEDAMESASKKQLFFFFVIAFGMPALLGVLLGITYHQGGNTDIFPNTWMFLPACAVMAGKLYFEKENCPARPFYRTYILFTAVMVILCMLQAFGHDMTRTAIIVGALASIVCLILLLQMMPEDRAHSGLAFSVNWKQGLLLCGLFVLLLCLQLLLRLLIAGVLAGDVPAMLHTVQFRKNAVMSLLLLPLWAVLNLALMFGEEYGWRYYLQPILQNRFGPRRGVLLLGLLWGLWHLPLNLYYYSPVTALLSLLGQLIACMAFGTFFGWVYLRTDNIWAVSLLHFLNNSFVTMFFAVSPAGTMWTWQSLLLNAAVFAVVFLPFLFTKEYTTTKNK